MFQEPDGFCEEGTYDKMRKLMTARVRANASAIKGSQL